MITALKTTIFARLAIIIFYILLAFFLIKPLFAENSTTSADTRVKTNIQQRIETRKGNPEARKEKIETRIASREAKIASRHAALKEKLQAFKDKKKAEIAERVNTNLNRINTNQTDQMLKHLNIMSTILDKLENLVDQGNPGIKDPVTTKAAITDARAVIAGTSALVSTQAANDYTIQVTSESKVRQDAQAQRTKLFNDLQNVRKSVIATKQKVADVIRTAKSGSIVKEGSASGKQ